VAFQHIPELGLIALASSAEESVLKTLWDAVRTVLLLMGPIAAALLFVALLSARLLRQSERTRRQLEEALARNQTLLREVHHRVKNNLQSVASLVQLQPISPEIKVEMGRRIAAMSAVHEQIYRSDNFGAVEIKGYLHTLIGSLRQSYRSDAEVLERLDDLMVDTDTAMPLALIVNEVVSNAFKHAFADGREGMIVITLERVDEATGVLTIEDNGVGFDPSQPASGMGRRLIAGLTEQLGGTSRFVREGGSRFSLTFPLLQPPNGP
jgi:two-component sensor histidine kinase